MVPKLLKGAIRARSSLATKGGGLSWMDVDNRWHHAGGQRYFEAIMIFRHHVGQVYVFAMATNARRLVLVEARFPGHI